MDELYTAKSKLDNISNMNEIQVLFEEVSPMNTSPNGLKAWELAKRRFFILLDSVDRDLLRFFKSSIISVNKVKDKPQKALK